MIEGFVSTSQAARFLNCHVNTILRRVAEAREGWGTFPYHQDMPGGKLSFKLSELEGWRKNRRIEREIQAGKRKLCLISTMRAHG